MTNWTEIWPALESYGCVAVVGALLVAVLLWRYPWVRTHLLPMPRLRWVSWDGGDVLLACMALLLALFLSASLLQKTGFYNLVYGNEPDDMRRMLWTMALAVPIWLVLVFTAVRARNQTYPADLGLSRGRWPANVVVGYAGFLLATPVVLGLFLLLKLTLPEGRDHPFSKLQKEGLIGVEWVVLFVSAGITAPVMEEILFRGLLLGWLRRASLAGQASFAAIVGTLSLSGSIKQKQDVKEPQDFAELMATIEEVSWGRIIFTCLLVAAYVGMLWRTRHMNLFMTQADFVPPEEDDSSAVDEEDDDEDGEEAEPETASPAWQQALARWQKQDEEQQRRKASLAIFGSALAFGLSHATWPDPIALVVLGLLLGWLAHRTQNLVPCIVLHGLFNLVASLTLLLLTLQPR